MSAMVSQSVAEDLMRDLAARLKAQHLDELRRSNERAELREAEVSALRAEVVELRAAVQARAARGEPGEAGRDGRDGRDGKDCDMELVEAMLREMVADLPKPRDGRDGVDGERGPAGKDGRDGVDGKDGAPGKDGRDGKDGADGRSGRDVDEERVERLVRDLVAAIPRPRDGRDGIDGKDGAPGRDGRDGERGERGPIGRDGRDGSDGVDGKDGRDALEVDVHDAIVEGRAYQRGAIARKDGGLARFDGAEWRPLVRGVRDFAVEQRDERTFVVKVLFSDGTERSTDLRVNSLIYREVWKAQAYEPGDAVTWDGCVWIAMRSATAADRPGESTAFRLAVKRGRNGKAGD